MSFAAFELHVGHRSVVFTCRSVDAKQKNAKLNNWTWLNGLLTIGEHQNFLEEGHWWCFCSMRSVLHCPIFIVFGHHV